MWDDDGRLYVVGFGSRDVRRFDREGWLIDVFVPAGPVLLGPTNMWFGPRGDLVVADWESGAIHRFDGADGTHLGAYVTGLANPEGWAIGPDGALYVGEWTAGRIHRIDAETGRSRGVFATGIVAPNSIVFVERQEAVAVSAR